MYSRDQILSILKQEYELTTKIIGKGRRYCDKKYDVISSSNECLELLLDTIESESQKEIQEEIFVVYVIYEDQVVMTVGCYPNKKYNFQLNNFIAKHINKNCPKNISMCLHSYTSSIFGKQFIVVKEPLAVMKQKLLECCSTAIIIESDHNYKTVKQYELAHEKILSCDYKEVSYHGIGNGGESLIIEITEDFRNLYKNMPDLKFGYTKITG